MSNECLRNEIGLKKIKMLLIKKIIAFYVHTQTFMWIYAERAKGEGKREGEGEIMQISKEVRQPYR